MTETEEVARVSGSSTNSEIDRVSGLSINLDSEKESGGYGNSVYGGSRYGDEQLYVDQPDLRPNYVFTVNEADFKVREKTVNAEKTSYEYTPSLAETDLLLASRGEIALMIDNEKIESYQELKVKKRLNEVDTFEFTVFITEDSQRGLVVEGKNVLMVENGKLFFKGRMEDVSYDSSFQATVEGEGMETRLLDRKTDREKFDNTPADEIAVDLANRTPLQTGEVQEAPLTSLAFDHDNLARALAGAANAVGYDWRINQLEEDGYEKDYIDFVDRIGSELPETKRTITTDGGGGSIGGGPGGS